MEDKYRLKIFQHNFCSVEMNIMEYEFSKNDELLVTWNWLGTKQKDNYNLLNCDRVIIHDLKNNVVEFDYKN